MIHFKKNIYKTSVVDAIPPTYIWRFSTGAASASCSASSYPIVYYSLDNTLVNLTQLYNNNACTIIATGGGNLFYKSQEQLQTMQIGTDGVISNVTSC